MVLFLFTKISAKAQVWGTHVLTIAPLRNDLSSLNLVERQCCRAPSENQNSLIMYASLTCYYTKTWHLYNYDTVVKFLKNTKIRSKILNFFFEFSS